MKSYFFFNVFADHSYKNKPKFTLYLIWFRCLNWIGGGGRGDYFKFKKKTHSNWAKHVTYSVFTFTYYYSIYSLIKLLIKPTIVVAAHLLGVPGLELSAELSPPAVPEPPLLLAPGWLVSATGLTVASIGSH